jgi:hypothetical protein
MLSKKILAVLIVMAVGEGHFTKISTSSSETAREWLARREKCLQLENAKTLPACREFFEPEVPEEKPTGTAIQFCKSLEPDAQSCRCRPNGLDVECTFKICGYDEGYYRDSDLPLFAARVAEELKSWGPKSLVSTKFVGFADGTRWGDEKKPKPQPVSEFLTSCLQKAAREHEKVMGKLSEHDYLDAELALLRGCALEEELALGIKSFKFDSTPSFSFENRKVGISDSSTRAAELEVIVANRCGSLSYGQAR